MPARKGLNYRWLHAGLFRDQNGNVHDAYYAFMPHAVYGEQIHYAVDNTGDAMGNFNIGRGKFDLITWDEHHIQLWQRYMTAAGVWVRKEGMRGRKYAREQLRQRYHDRRFHDPYPEGKTGSRSMGPPLNVNFKEDDYSGPVPAAFRFARRAVLDKDKCYPETNIPLSADDIKIGAWKAHNPSAIRVVGDFLTGSMAPSMFGRFAEVQLDRIESAFFELGWRVNRNALQRANEDMRDGRATNAFGSRAWRQAPPIRVDRFKGEEIEELMRGMREDAEAAAGDGDEDDDSDNDRPAGPGGWQYGGDGGDGSNGGPDDSSDDDSDDDQPRRPSARGKRKARLQQRSEQIDSDSSDSSDDLPANPTNKRKKKGKAVDRRKQKKSNGRCQPTSFQYVRDSDDSDEKDLFVTDTRQSSPVVAGPSNRSGRVVRDRDEELARRLSQEEENAAAARALAQAPVEVLSDDDEYDYLSDNSPKKGKGKAARKRLITSEDSDDNVVIIGPPKRSRTNAKPKVVISLLEDDSDPDIQVDEAKSCKPYIKDEVIDIKDDDSDME